MFAELEEVTKKWFRRSGDRIRSVTKQNQYKQYIKYNKTLLLKSFFNKYKIYKCNMLHIIQMINIYIFFRVIIY